MKRPLTILHRAYIHTQYKQMAANRQFYVVPKESFEGEQPSNIGEYEKQEGSDKNSRSNAFSNKVETANLDESIPNQKKSLLSYISKNVIGENKTFTGPFGLRRVTYLDYVASGRSLKFIEDYIQEEVLPEYGNTHTTTSVTSLQTTLFRHEARDIIRNACNASEHDSVIFVGSGTTGAVHKLIHSLNLKASPVVFVGPYEHHSNILPWKEAGGQVVRIQEDSSGRIDVADLEAKLKASQPLDRQLIGVFSAASNVTGVLSDVDAITVCLHRHRALAFWDYATAAPYVKVDMNPYVGGADQGLVYKDAIYFSVHKFVGGTSTPGVLIAKKILFRHPVPHGCGGGTVFFVRREGERYLQEAEVKEEGGTPAIVEAVRAGMVMQLKESLGSDAILERDSELVHRARSAWAGTDSLVLLGPQAGHSLPIFSFLVHHADSGRFLHHNFVASILNDVFGIQARGGCACAGPYAMDLLGMPEHKAKEIEETIAEDSRLDRTHLRRRGEYSHREILRPGFVRVNLPYFIDEAGLEFVLEAIKLTANHAWALLPQYLFNPETGEWRQKDFQTFKDRKWLGHISYTAGHMTYQRPPQHVKGPLPESYEDCLSQARAIFSKATKAKVKLGDQAAMFDKESEALRWFLLPSEANVYLQGSQAGPVSPLSLPFCPPALLAHLGHIAESEKRMTHNCNANHDDSWSLNEEKVTTPNEQRTTSLFSEGFASVLDKGFEENDNVSSDKNRHLQNINGIGESEVNTKNKEASDVDAVADLMDTLSILQNINSNNNSQTEQTCAVVNLSNKQSSLGIEGNTILPDKHILSKNTLPDVSILNKDNPPDLALLNKKDTINRDNTAPASKQTESAPVVCPYVKKPTLQPEFKLGLVEEAPTSTVRWHPSPKHIFAPMTKAIEEFDMIRSGDRLLVCLSGGKDSLSLLHAVRQYQFRARSMGVKFEFGAVTVDPMTPAFDPSPLKLYCKALGVPYFYESQAILDQAEGLPYECASICSFCSRMKRGRIYAAARREGYNLLALGQHLDDLSESFLMSFFHNGSLNTMKAHYTIKKGDLRVIRPFVYVRESDLRAFAEKKKLSVIAENCPACFEAPKERHRMKQLLASQEVMFPRIYGSMKAAMRPLMARTIGEGKGVDGTRGGDSEED